MQRWTTWSVALVLMLFCAVAAADEPTSGEPLGKLVGAAGGHEAFAGYGLLHIVLDEEETTAEGETHTKTYTAVVNTADPDQARLEMDSEIVMARTGTEAWATIRGQLDERRQTPMMVRGTINQKIFPILAPFSLASSEVELGATETTTWQGDDVQRVEVVLPSGFFASPVMNTTWYALVEPATHQIRALEYQPPRQFREAGAEGVRYIIQRREDLGGFTLPTRLFLEGLDPLGRPNGHTRTVTVTYSRDTRVPMQLFVNPEKLEAFESGDVPEF